MNSKVETETRGADLLASAANELRGISEELGQVIDDVIGSRGSDDFKNECFIDALTRLRSLRYALHDQVETLSKAGAL